MSTNDSPSLLQVIEDAVGEIAPSKAILHVRLSADRFFSGRAAFEKAEELRRLVTLLRARGFSDDALALAGASLDVSSGLFTKSSSVTYEVRIHVRDVDRVGEALDAVADCKRATLSYVTWDYDAASARAKLVAECGARALTKAKALAAALGVAIERVHAAREEEPTEAPPLLPGMGNYPGAPAPVTRARGSIASELGGLDLAPKKTITVRVRVECRIAA